MMEPLNVDGQIASRLWEAQSTLERIALLVDVMGRESHHSYLENQELAEEIVEQGRMISEKIREFALRMDRTVSSRY